ncbi:hypothetical protein ACFSB1_10695 [Halopseudomonas phragmitis]|uniref:Uncharacterized protein n=1 Tax=Halopseudomonas phragmitis TaxID=1931241 RepID=A0A1V0B9F7_9GAMM|nr:hypothetical protein [Halopseudomonas phragmitis]AQZ96552.1 hypothetical protein BVH74_18140 [Halopseudomonas phragmitis]
MPELILGGIPVTLCSGVPAVSYDAPDGYTDAVLSGGRPVRMRHFKKRTITITGTGWIDTGLDSLDWDAYHELWSPAPMRLSTVLPQATLTSDARPDESVIAEALVSGRRVSTPVEMVGRVASMTPVAGASLYEVVWYPRFTVLCTPPPASLADRVVSWQLFCREV